jgi:LysM repeat protein
MDLVKTEILAPVNQGMQRDLERLTAENLLLKRQLEAAQAQISALQTTPPQTFTPANVPRNSVPQSRPVSSQTATSSIAATRATQMESRPVAPTQTHPRTHVVKAGETVTSIAAKYKVKLNAFLLANPNVDPRRLKIGQVLNVPSS